MSELYEVITPNPDFEGIRVGVRFNKGRAKCSLKKARILVANFKYRCPELEAEEKAKQEAAKKQAQPAPAAESSAATAAPPAMQDKEGKPQTTSAKQQPKWMQHRK